VDENFRKGKHIMKRRDILKLGALTTVAPLSLIPKSSQGKSKLCLVDPTENRLAKVPLKQDPIPPFAIQEIENWDIPGVVPYEIGGAVDYKEQSPPEVRNKVLQLLNRSYNKKIRDDAWHCLLSEGLDNSYLRDTVDLESVKTRFIKYCKSIYYHTDESRMWNTTENTKLAGVLRHWFPESLEIQCSDIFTGPETYKKMFQTYSTADKDYTLDSKGFINWEFQVFNNNGDCTNFRGMRELGCNKYFQDNPLGYGEYTTYFENKLHGMPYEYSRWFYPESKTKPKYELVVLVDRFDDSPELPNNYIYYPKNDPPTAHWEDLYKQDREGYRFNTEVAIGVRNNEKVFIFAVEV
jgi:hypothetical protein